MRYGLQRMPPTLKHHMESPCPHRSNLESLLSHGQEYFSQASNTPFATGPIANILRPLEWNNASKQILNGTFDIDSITSNVDDRDIRKNYFLGITLYFLGITKIPQSDLRNLIYLCYSIVLDSLFILTMAPSVDC
jgi:hypothetical protein